MKVGFDVDMEDIAGSTLHAHTHRERERERERERDAPERYVLPENMTYDHKLRGGGNVSASDCVI